MGGYRALLRAFIFALGVVIAPWGVHAQSWTDIVKAAEAEGAVNVHGGPGRAFVTALSDGFAKAYPKIKINYDGAPGREGIPKIVRERQSGIFNWDVYVGGPTSVLPALKPIDGLAPLRPALVLPEVVDDKAWRGGFDAGWMDADKKYMFAFDLTEETTVLVNWDFVKKDDLKNVTDLLKPQFAGKIVSLDPRALGDAVFSFQAFHINFGEPFVIDLLSKQKIVYTTNRRQSAEWLVRGIHPIGIATPKEDIQSFQEQGLGKNIQTFRVGANTPVAGSGFGNVAMLDRPPHPNAAKVYINWLLSKAGQTEWKIMGRNTRRMDTPLAAPEFAPPADKMTVNLQAEPHHPMRQHIGQLAKKHIPTEAAK